LFSAFAPFTGVDGVAQLRQLAAALEVGADLGKSRNAFHGDGHPTDLGPLSSCDLAALLAVHLQGTGDVGSARAA